MDKDNKNTEHDNTDKKLHISDVSNSYDVGKFKRMENAIKIILTNIEFLGTRQNKEYTISKQDINTLKDALK
jgi:hypothetical protein